MFFRCFFLIILFFFSFGRWFSFKCFVVFTVFFKVFFSGRFFRSESFFLFRKDLFSNFFFLEEVFFCFFRLFSFEGFFFQQKVFLPSRRLCFIWTVFVFLHIFVVFLKFLFFCSFFCCGLSVFSSESSVFLLCSFSLRVFSRVFFFFRRFFCRMFFLQGKVFFVHEKTVWEVSGPRVSVTPPKPCDVKRFGKSARSLTLSKRFHDA